MYLENCIQRRKIQYQTQKIEDIREKKLLPIEREAGEAMKNGKARRGT